MNFISSRIWIKPNMLKSIWILIMLNSAFIQMISSNLKSMATTLTNGIAMFIPFVQESLSDRSMDRQLGQSTRASRTVWVTLKVFANGLSRNRYNSLNQPPFGDFIPQQCRNLTIGWIVFVLLLGLFITIVNVLVITVLSRDSFYHNTYGSGFVILYRTIGAIH